METRIHQNSCEVEIVGKYYGKNKFSPQVFLVNKSTMLHETASADVAMMLVQ